VRSTSDTSILSRNEAQITPNANGKDPSTEGSVASKTTLDEIIVTAEKRAESLGKTPLAVSVLSEEQLNNAGVTGLKDLTSAVPNLEIKTVNIVNSVQVTIRGVSNSDFNAGGNPAVATYIDGIYVPRTQGLSGDLYDIERVEVLRGPQGTLYGRNSTGGNLNILTANADKSFGAAAGISYGNYDDIQTHGMVNLPLTDSLAVRAAFVTHRNNGIYNTEGTTAQNYGKADDFGGRLTAQFTPTDNFKWRLSIDDFVSRGTSGLEFATAPDGKPIDNRPIFNRPLNSSPEPSEYVSNLMIRSRMDWQLTGGWALTYTAGHQDLKWRSVLDMDGTDLQVLDGHRTAGSQSYSHEINVIYDHAKLKNVFGATYFHETEQDSDVYHLFTVGLTFRTGEVTGPFVEDKASGVYDQATYNLTDRLRVTAGARFSTEDKISYTDQEVFAPIDTTYAAILAVNPIGVLPPGWFYAPKFGNRGKWSSVNWKGGLQYEVSDRTMSYLTVTTGFKSGGQNFGNTSIPTFNPETVTNYEFGLKTRIFDDKVSLNTAVFYEDYKDLQVTQISQSIAQVTENAARARIYGIENEVQWRITGADRLSGFVNYLKATYADYNNAVDAQTGIVYASLTGKYLPHAPLFSMRVQYAHDFALPNGSTITPLASVYWQTKTYLRELNFPIDRVDGFSKTNLNLTYADGGGHWTAQAYVENLEDKVVRNGGLSAVGVYYSDYSPPRMFGARISYKY
jgi:iron complex outermembrane receptor protein